MIIKFYNDAYFKHSKMCDQQLISAACLVLFNSSQHEIIYILIFCSLANMVRVILIFVEVTNKLKYNRYTII